jgi:hypothetical protein
MTRKDIAKKVTATIVLCAIAGMASAHGGRGGHGGGGWGGHGPVAAPEIDPASASSALTLLLGGLAVVRSRRAARGK